MEARGIVASWDRRRDEFDVWVSTQSPHDVRTVTSRITGVPERCIRVRMGDVGGGFGQKAYLARDEQIVLLAAFHLGVPIKWIEDRRENLVAATSSRADRCTVTIAADPDGRILGIALDHVDDVGAYPIVGSAGAMAAVIFTGPYRIPKMAVTTRSAYTNTCPRAPYRGPWQFETFAREQAVDALARVHGARSSGAPTTERDPSRRAAVHHADRAPARGRLTRGDARAGGRHRRLRGLP
jgi:carbon-monoxide dehydrogenase large subunit